ncbi:MAG: DUF4040 domain-containing protein [Planctomycetota bacterium]|nr:MAG: DUF4040 domain-containing protein [Planctomycetota bacterium]
MDDSTTDDTGRGNDRPRLGVAESLLATIPLIAFLVAAYLTVTGRTLRLVWSWVPSLQVEASFQLDGLSLLFCLLISGIGVMIFVYAPGYFRGHRDRWRLYTWLLLFMAAMLGLVTADNVIMLFVCWELTSLTSYLLIGFKHESEKARAAALQALLITGAGGLCLLAGLLLLSRIAESQELSTILGAADALKQSPLITPAIILILLGAFTKSAQFPFHFWLPNAMEAPTPVSAYLHSATMVKAGVYLVARLSPALTGVPLWDNLIVAAGGVTAVVGGAYAVRQYDLKRILAFSTISALGCLMLLLGLGTKLAIEGAMLFLLSHALYKATLFLVAGAVDLGTGTRDIRRLYGLFASYPLLAAAAILAACSKSGLPPFGGFLAKEVVYEATTTLSGWATWATTIVALLANACFVAVGGLAAVHPFFGKPGEPSVVPHESPPGSSQLPAGGAARLLGWRLVFPPVVLGLLGIVLGVLPSVTALYFISPAMSAVMGQDIGVKLSLWHGFNLPLLLSVLTVAAGVGIYVQRRRFVAWVDAGGILRYAAEGGPQAAYRGSLALLKFTATWQTRILQNGRLRLYLITVLASFAGLVIAAFLYRVEYTQFGKLLNLRLYELVFPVLILAALAMAVTSTSRLAAVCALGVIGFALAMLFVLFGAPDLAMTQLAIETLTVILFVFVIYRLPRFATLSSRGVRIRDAVVSLAVGGMMTVIVLAATSAHAPSRVSQFFVDNSLAIAKGRNMVNVILVDFRGVDTLGEITVIAVAALGIFSLMRLRLEPSQVPAEAAADRTETTLAANGEDASSPSEQAAPDKPSATGRGG